jgi:hypothetical protein
LEVARPLSFSILPQQQQPQQHSPLPSPSYIIFVLPFSSSIQSGGSIYIYKYSFLKKKRKAFAGGGYLIKANLTFFLKRKNIYISKITSSPSPREIKWRDETLGRSRKENEKKK